MTCSGIFVTELFVEVNERRQISKTINIENRHLKKTNSQSKWQSVDLFKLRMVKIKSECKTICMTQTSKIGSTYRDIIVSVEMVSIIENLQ